MTTWPTKEEIERARAWLEEYCNENGITQFNDRYSEMARDILGISYSIGGDGSYDVISKMVPSYIDTIIETNNMDFSQ